jgi:hypothetical protein
MMSDTTSNMPAPDNAGVHLMRSECLLQGGSLSVKSLLALAAASPAAAAEVAQQCVHAVDAVQLSADPDAAIEFLVQVTDVCAGTLGETHPATGALRCRLGDLLLAERCPEQARQQYEIVLAAHRPNVLGDSDVIARALSGLGDVLRTERKYVAALMCLQRALRAPVRDTQRSSCNRADAHPSRRALVRAATLYHGAVSLPGSAGDPRSDPGDRAIRQSPRVCITSALRWRRSVICGVRGYAWRRRWRSARIGWGAPIWRRRKAWRRSVGCWRILVTTRAHNTVSSAPPRSIVSIQGIGRPVSAAVAVQVSHRRRGGARWMNLLRREP